MADFNHIYGAGMRNGYIRTSDGTKYDIDAVINIEGDPSQNDTDIKGDDTIKATFSDSRKEDLTISANGISMDVLQAITGNSVSSSAGGSQIAVGTQSELNPPFVEVGAEVNARTDQGTSVFIRKVWHKVQLGKTKITAGNGNELAVEITGSATQTSVDIQGVALTTTRVATLFVLSGQAA